ncbi:hypothetical protein GCM10022378_11400 [Salinicoccus jeotgali]|uniref:ParB/Sulfiredoxin domain-containing protein n=1 Tax=Salinicoccus jeotgali TaxID=381634 RepID=A0ABP7EQN6_9STAP
MTVTDKYKVAYSVYETDQYDDFSFMEENRGISANHVKALVKNIKDGYEMPPIIVNEHMEVMDGQHRLMAHKELDEPVTFIIQRDMKENAIQRANTDVSKWTTPQHIEYHIKRGNEHYAKLNEFKEYSGMPVVQAMRILGKSADSRIKSSAKIIQHGVFVVTHETDAYSFTDEVVLRMRMEAPTGKIISALKRLYDAGVDTKRLVTAVNVTEDELKLLNTVPKIIETIVKVYNTDLKRADQVKMKEYGKNQYKVYI